MKSKYIEYINNNWIHEVALKDCLADPRLDKSLQAFVTLYTANFYLAQLPTKIFCVASKTSKLDDQALIFSSLEIQNDKDYFAFGSTSKEKQDNKTEITSSRNSLKKKIKDLIEASVKNNCELNLTDLHPHLKESAIQYYEIILKTWEYRSKQTFESFSETKINENINFSLEQQQQTLPSQKNDLIDESTSFSTHYINSESGICAYITTLVGRPKQNCKETHQEDRAGFLPNVRLHYSWSNRIPELLAYTSQKLSERLHEEYPPFDYSNPDRRQKNCSSLGSTLTMSLIYENAVYTLCLGDSSSVLFKIDNDSRKVESKLLTWSHNPGSGSKAEIFETKRAQMEDAQIVKIGRDQNTRLAGPHGALAVSRGIGDRECPGSSNIGTLSVAELPRDNSSELFLVLGSDGLFDFLSLKSMENIIQCIKSESVSECLALQAFRNPRNHDNITAVLVPAQYNSFTFVADGHGGDHISNFINANLITIFKMIAENLAPNRVLNVEPTKSPQLKKRRTSSSQSGSKSEEETTSYSTSVSFFKSPPNRKTPSIQTYNIIKMVKKIESLPHFYNSSETDVAVLKRKLLADELDSYCFITNKYNNYNNFYLVYAKINHRLETSTLFLPTTFPMNYSEYKSIVPGTYIIYSEEELEKVLSKITFLEPESQELTQKI